MQSEDITIHVDYNADHSPMTFGDANGEPILSYHQPTERQLANLERLRAGRIKTRGPFPDGWVLTYEATWCGGYAEDERVPRLDAGSNPGDHITGISDLTAVDDAVAAARDHLVRMGYREPPA